jgi:hypothetical protein
MAGMEPIFQMTDVAVKTLTRLKGYKFMKDFFVFYSEDNKRGQFINWSKEKYTADIENMRQEMNMVLQLSQPRMQIALADKVKTFINEDGILLYDSDTIKELVANHNKQVAAQNKNASDPKKRDSSAIHRKNLVSKLKGKEGNEIEPLEYMEPKLMQEYIKFLSHITVQFKTEAEKYLRMHEQSKAFFQHEDVQEGTYKNINSGKTTIEKYAGLLLPALLKNPEDITIIDGWLEQERLITKYDGDTTGGGPYKWVPLNKNKEKDIVSILNLKIKDVKILSFAARSQIAALGYWLHATGRILIDKNKKKGLNKYNASKIAEAVLRYYNVEITESNKKEFQDKGGEANVVHYSSYYDGLAEVLPKNIK